MKVLSIIILIFLISCDKPDKSYTFKALKTNQIDSSKIYVDTILILKNLTPSTAKRMDRLTEELVKSNLYKHFKEQNYFIEDEYPSPLTEEDYDKSTVRYNLTHFVNLNGDSFEDAIVEYWVMPPGAAGHCYLPHKAMVVSTADNYAFVNPDFLDSFFTIDSVKSINNKTYVYGCDFDCGGSDKCKRKIRAVIYKLCC